MGLAAITILAVILRMIYPTAYPWGFNEDAAKLLTDSLNYCAHYDLWWRVARNGYPLPWFLIETCGLDRLGLSARWAIRMPSLLGGILSVPMAYVATRSVERPHTSGLVAAGLVAVLPWSLLYGRTSIGAEMVFWIYVIIWALARSLRSGADRWSLVLLRCVCAAVGSAGLLYQYLAMRGWWWGTVASSVLFKQRRRWLPLGIAFGGLALYAPVLYYDSSQWAWTGFGPKGVGLSYPSLPFLTGLGLAFFGPYASNAWMTVQSAAMHPPLILGLAGLGWLRLKRRYFILCIGLLLAGGATTIFGLGPHISTHRLIAVFPFIPIFVGAVFENGRLSRIVATLVISYTAWWSVTLYFSPSFWPPASVGVYCYFGCNYDDPAVQAWQRQWTYDGVPFRQDPQRP